jgi:phospholipid/cholesterol/gamma-HCH transport system substrate-binding protein
VQRLLASTDASLASLNAGEGRVGQLLASQQLYESLHGSLVKMQALIRDLREDPRKYMRIKVF